MLGTVLWNSGALGAWSTYNLIAFSPETGSLASSQVAGRAIAEAGAHAHESLAGNRQLGFLGDFYFRFHITILLLDLGNLVSEQTEEVAVWNAHRRAWILADIELLNGQGIELSGQPDPPLQYAPLQERTYTLSISEDGPAAIDAVIVWEFSNGEEISLSVVGARVVPWNWMPEWSAGMIERIQWYTEVLPAARGEEQRRSLRIDPRHYIEFSSVVSDDDRRIMESTLWGWGARRWAVPLWFDGHELTASLPAGSTIIAVDPAQRGYEVGGLVLLTNGDPRTFEVIEIDGLGSNIALSRPTQQAWGVGTRVYPTRPAVIENLATVKRFTGVDGTIRLQWRMVDPSTWEAAATPTYRDLPVLEQKPNWSEDPTLAFERKVTVFDAGVGLTQEDDEAEMPLTVQRMRFTLENRAAINTWKKRLWALRGKQGAIWVPTWSQDLTVVALIGDTALNIDVEWAGYTKYLSGQPNRNDVRIELVNGTVFYRRITGSAEISATVERLSMDTSLGVTVPLGQVAIVSFMGLSRSDSDTHELSYFTGDCADTIFSARGFRHGL